MIGLKLKYKKIVLAISVGTICLGGVVYTIANHNFGSQKNKPGQNVSVTDDSFTSGTFSTEQGDMVLEKNAYPEINELVKQYFAARVSCDMNKLGTLVSDVENINAEELKTLGTFVEEYQNIDTYTVAGKEKDSYVVFAYTDIKLKDIKTPAPGLTGLYVNKDKNGNFVIFNGMMTDDQNAYKESVYESDSVKELIASVQDKYKKALESDKDLNNFYTEAQKEQEEKQKNAIPGGEETTEGEETKEAE